MYVNFKYQIGDIVKVPLYGSPTTVEILERSYHDNGIEQSIVYTTDLFTDGVDFTQDEIDKYNEQTGKK